jgi:hypothetical protein
MKKPNDWSWEYWIALNVIGYSFLLLFTLGLFNLLQRV